MSYKVLNTFKEKEHKDAIYKAGKIYPKEGFKANDKRVSFLQEIHPVYGVRFLGPIEGVPLLPEIEVPDPSKESTKKASTKKKSDAK